MAYPAVNPDHGVLGSASGAVAVGVGSAVIGALAGAGFVATKKLTAEADKEQKDQGKKE
jgi:hydrogenase small subunit